MNLSDTFLPSAGVVGVLPMVTYFVLGVSTLAFFATFLFVAMTQSALRSDYRSAYTISAVISAITAVTYFLLQSAYRDVLSELATINDAENRQVLVRESFNILMPFRYMDWAVTIPLLLLLTTRFMNVSLVDNKKAITFMLLASVLMVLAGYIGSQQLGFDNEIRTGPKLIWGMVSLAGYGVAGVTLYRFWKQAAGGFSAELPWACRLITFGTLVVLGIYQVGYVLTLSAIDVNWIQIAFSIADLLSKTGVALLLYWVASKKE